MISEAKWKAMRGEVTGRPGTRLAGAARLGIAAAVLIFAVLPLQAQTESVLYSFGGPPTDGTPSGTLARDASGNLYGTTEMGGGSNLGTVFKLHPNGDGTYTESLLHSFTNTGGDGETPETGVVVDGSGNLYGTTQNGGSTNCVTGCGIVFSLHPNGDGTYTESVLHGFTGHPDGQSPGALLIDASGNLYGTTLYGGTSTAATFCKGGCGTVFELANNSGTYTYSVLFSFTTNDFYGIDPGGNLVIDASGDLFGTATSGGGSTASCALGVEPCLNWPTTPGAMYRVCCTASRALRMLSCQIQA